jgi:DNA-binding transcriptional ArsR family regulator
MLNRMVEYRGNQLDTTYSALSHPVRRAVLEHLRASDATVTEIAVPFSMSLAAVSKHIRVLEEAGLLERAVHGREHRLALNPSPLRPAARWLDTYQAFWEDRLDLLEAKLRGRHRR